MRSDKLSDKVAEKLWRRMANTVRFGQVISGDNTGKVATLQVKLSHLETFPYPMVQQFGFASGIPSGSDVIVLHAEGDPSKGVVIGTNSQQNRPTTLKDGDSIIHDASGASITVTAEGIVINSNGQPVKINTGGGDVDINAGGGNVNVVADELQQTGSLSVSNGISMSGTLDVTGVIIVNGTTVTVP